MKIDIVIAHYKESLKWLESFNHNNIRNIFLYSKNNEKKVVLFEAQNQQKLTHEQKEQEKLILD